MGITRQSWVIAHRWAGLTLALFLTIAGSTGILLAWNDDLETVISPHLFEVTPPHQGARLLSPVDLRRRVLARYRGGIIDYMPLHFEAGRSVSLNIERLDARGDHQVAWSDKWDQLFVDPYTGGELGRRKWGDISQGSVNLMPFIYRLHYSLALGPYGSFAFGAAALIWTIDSFVGFYLTLPVSIRRNVGAAPAGGPSALRNWWRRWQPSWRIRWSSSSYKISFDLHRAGGLWIWPMLLVFAWSGVAFNLTPVYAPVMKLFGAKDLREQLTPLSMSRTTPKLDFDTAIETGRRLATREMARRHIAIQAGGENTLYHMPAMGVYAYRFATSRDFTDAGGRTMVAFDSNTGALRAVDLPQGGNGVNTFTNWIMALHMAEVWGFPYRIAVSLIGALVTILSVTGVIIWTKKRSGRVGRMVRGVRC